MTFDKSFAKRIQGDVLLWLPVAIVPIVNGMIRLATYQDALGEPTAAWVSAFMDCILILLYGALVASPDHAHERAAVWLACTTLLHVALGSVAFGMPLSVLAGKYDLLAGEPWLLVNAAIVTAPWLGALIRQRCIRQRARVLVLVGPKGAGKSTIGRMIEAGHDAHFLDVERVAIRVLRSMGDTIDETYARRAFAEISRAIRANERHHANIVVETTGASDETPDFIDALKSRYDVRLIRVRAKFETCAARIEARNQAKQILVSDDLIREIYGRSEALDLPWDAVIDNDRPRSHDDIVAVVGPYVRKRRTKRADHSGGMRAGQGPVCAQATGSGGTG